MDLQETRAPNGTEIKYNPVRWVVVGKPEEKRGNLEDLGVDERKILKRIFKKQDAGM